MSSIDKPAAPRVPMNFAIPASAFLMSMRSGRFVPVMALVTSSVAPHPRGIGLADTALA